MCWLFVKCLGFCQRPWLSFLDFCFDVLHSLFGVMLMIFDFLHLFLFKSYNIFTRILINFFYVIFNKLLLVFFDNVLLNSFMTIKTDGSICNTWTATSHYIDLYKNNKMPKKFSLLFNFKNRFKHQILVEKF